MPSFDTVSEANMDEVKNAIVQTNKVVTNRFDLKGTSAKVELKEKEREVTVFGDSEFHLDQILIEVTQTMGKRKVDVRFLDIGKVEKIGGDKVKQVIKIKNGIETDDAKKSSKPSKKVSLKCRQPFKATQYVSLVPNAMIYKQPWHCYAKKSKICHWNLIISAINHL